MTITSKAITEFARAAESLNELARSLRDSGVAGVTTGTDARVYEDGPRLEKWIEVPTRHEGCFCWWLDLSVEGDEIVVDANVSNTNSDFAVSIGPRRAASDFELAAALTEAVGWLRDQPIRD
ncbi:hypothetical protein [Lysobacter enzymogenes]|uniref:hypothetical protein n=1 Tax=Lysobacter enzymogenes TaxID=69 RepID=UPI001A95711B|nr:hypothetical protein [Lysobacter enzymogenes]QQP98572.1 hypothetical protein JHW38_11580 [Lysobacter enzymogenes]